MSDELTKRQRDKIREIYERGQVPQEEGTDVPFMLVHPNALGQPVRLNQAGRWVAQTIIREALTKARGRLLLSAVSTVQGNLEGLAHGARGGEPGSVTAGYLISVAIRLEKEREKYERHE